MQERRSKDNKINHIIYNLLQIILFIGTEMLVSAATNCIRRRYYHWISLSLHYKKVRWLFSMALSIFYFYRVSGLSYDVITYLIGFYLLQLLVSYLTPKGLEDQQQMQSYDEITDTLIIQTADTEYFINKEPQFKFQNNSEPDKPLVSSISQHQIWERITFAFLLGIICTLFKSIQVDVFWPLLMVYFVVLVSYTIHKIVKKMHKYKYSFSDFNKKVVGLF